MSENFRLFQKDGIYYQVPIDEDGNDIVEAPPEEEIDLEPVREVRRRGRRKK